MKQIMIICVTWVFILAGTGPMAAEEKTFVGTEACKECHEAQYNTFMTHSKKAKSFESVKKMEKKLSPEEFQACFECHTTGYGQKGGFVSETQTPELKIAGCEVCHGPGSRHAETGDPEDIVGKLTAENCLGCHSSERVDEFKFKPLLFGGSH